MARPKQIPERPSLTKAQIDVASYLGSKEHKAVRWWGGLPGARVNKDGIAKRPKKQLTTLCHLVTDNDRAKATCWVKEALGQGQFEFFEGDKVYPKHLWHKDKTGQMWFGFCINSILGKYKGWPIEEIGV